MIRNPFCTFQFNLHLVLVNLRGRHVNLHTIQIDYWLLEFFFLQMTSTSSMEFVNLAYHPRNTMQWLLKKRIQFE